MKDEWSDGGESGPPEFSLTERNQIVEAVSLRRYSLRVWKLNDLPDRSSKNVERYRLHAWTTKVGTIIINTSRSGKLYLGNVMPCGALRWRYGAGAEGLSDEKRTVTSRAKL
ncbi:hypothetical protein EVAR_52666_1 [Eumeta japonica]|uniref:Uncharacterized protein n=1 Tax=Eumeta variegata TaxID=151549 RepID=A0A4C1Z2Z4_EUMVA|nr:hypothetical protein EVAR_52666_1 [Eumeta japonica]